MAFYQCRGYISAVSSGSKKIFVTISANAKFDCESNMIIKPKTDILDSVVYNIFMELEMANLMLPPSAPRKDPIHILALKQDYMIVIEKDLASSLDLSTFDFEVESTFIIKDQTPNGHELVYIQVGPDNNDD